MNPNHLLGDLEALKRRPAALVLLFFASFFLLVSGGRLASGDAAAQMRAAMLLVTTGRLGTTLPPGGETGGWIANKNGRYYEPHDIGNIALMVPAALTGIATSPRSSEQMVADPPISARVGTSLTYALLSAVACYFMFKSFAMYNSGRGGFPLSLAFATSTIFWPYAKTAWDVTGAACFMCAAMYFSARLLHDSRFVGSTILAAIALGLACSFRFSLAPFFAPSVVLAIYLARPRPALRHYVAFVLSFSIIMLPSFAYNYVRMGSPFLPGTMAPQYLEGNNALTGNISKGLFGLLFSPNKGIFLYSPVLLLLFGLPFVWKRIADERRRLFVAFGLGCIPYVMLIAKMRNWGGFGWGPRFLVPVLPVLFFGASLVISCIWKRHRALILGLTVVSVLVNAPGVFVNWNLTTLEFPGAGDQDARVPRQMMATWTGLVMGLQGKPLPAPPELINDPIRSAGARFPDLWTVRLMERSRLGLIAGLGMVVLLIIPAAWSLALLLRQDTWRAGIDRFAGPVP